jgi:hypothetical protein
LAAVAHLADGEFLVEKQTVNKERLWYSEQELFKTNGYKKRKTKLRAKVNLNKEVCIKVIPPFM